MKHIIKEMWEELPMWGKVTIAILLLGAVVILGSCSFGWWKYYPQDNMLEEMAEEVIKDKTGLDIDVTPLSPEKGFNFGPNPGD